MVIILLFFFPLLKRDYLKRANLLTDYLGDKFSSIQKTLQDKTNLIAANHVFVNCLEDYFNNYSKANKIMLSLYLDSIVANESKIIHVIIDCEGFESVESGLNTNRINKNMLNNQKYMKLKIIQINNYFSPITNIQYDLNSLNVTSNVCVFAKNYHIGESKYTLTIFFDLTTEMKEINNLVELTIDDYCIASDEKEIIYTSRDDMNWYNDEIFQRIQADRKEENARGIFFYCTTDDNSWNIISFISNATIIGQIFRILLFMIVFILGVLLIIVAFISPYIVKQLAPLKVIADLMASYSPEGPPVISDIHTNNEIDEISNKFNFMVKKIDEYIRQVYEEKCLEEKIKYSLLTSQIDPHFIYNTMDIISALARQGKIKDVVSVNQSLQRILQDRLELTELKVFDKVSREIQTIVQYQNIMEHRYGKNVKISYNIDKAINECLIPKNLIQPIMENSYYHGLTNESGIVSGEIKIAICAHEDAILIRISDNGAGINEEDLDFFQKHNRFPNKSTGSHIGIENVLNRLSYLYGENYELSIESRYGCDTIVTIIIPKKEGYIEQ
jgi:sensor histidine kinase YesM